MLKYPNKYEIIAQVGIMLLFLCIVSIYFADECQGRQNVKNNGILSDCKAYYRSQEQQYLEEGISTLYLGSNCIDKLYTDEDNIHTLPEAPRCIDVRVNCEKRIAGIVWMPKVNNDTARDLYGFLLQAQLAIDSDSTSVCYGIFMNETISSLLLTNSIQPPEFEFSCFQSAPETFLEASMWSISSQHRNSCQSVSNCVFLVDQYSGINLESTIDDEKLCGPDCNCWRPDWRLRIITDESAQCPDLQLILNNVISTLVSLHIIIIHKETGEAVLRKDLQSITNATLTVGLQKSGIYYAKLETGCDIQRPSPCPGFTRFISDFVSVSCDIPTTLQPTTIFDARVLIFLCIAIVSAVLLILCFCFKGSAKRCFEKWNITSNVSGDAHNPNYVTDRLLKDTVYNLSERQEMSIDTFGEDINTENRKHS